MTPRDLLRDFDRAASARELADFVERCYPICRSLTGDGVRETLKRIGDRVAPSKTHGEVEGFELEIHEVPSGTRVLDWEVPKEWNVRQAWIKDPSGNKVVDFADHNLHLLGYSVPVHETLSLTELDQHLYSLPDHPDLVPYRTSYFQERWGFCLAHRRRQSLADGDYEVLIDSSLEKGHLTYGELLLPGRVVPGHSQREVLISTHVCHPSLCNDNLSGLSVVSSLARRLQQLATNDRRYSYRFLFLPGTIGAITWLARNDAIAGRIAHGLVAANLGDRGGFHYKKSRRGDTEIDRTVPLALEDLGHQVVLEEFSPYGYDERQYCSPGFDLPMGSLTRTPYGRYPEYHTSADDLDLVSGESLAGSLEAYLSVIAVLEANRTYRNLNPKGEPQLGRRGLYGSLGGDDTGRERELALLWVLNQSDGENSLLDISARSGIAFSRIEKAARSLIEAELLAEVS